jgi:hypothetical protein
MDGETEGELFNLDDAALEEERIVTQYNERFKPGVYRQVFYPPASGQWKIDALFPEGFFESAKLLLSGVASGRLNEGIEGVAAIFLSRHYLELAIKYALFHSRWLQDERRNAAVVTPVGHGHNLQKLWSDLSTELKGKPGVVPTGLDLDFVAAFVAEFNAFDPKNWRFRYPGEQLPPAPSSDENLGIDFASLLFDIQRVFDVLGSLDNYLIETYGENREWNDLQDDW